ncbi:hypothetical protein AC249_AIPGENE28286 [Exaiptasia diaphana]|nr:hypothetical protein AC249_AIPGENE28286 [Exaiptasia diaphana]
MSKDSRGHSRKECLVKDCDCEDYERPTGDDEGSKKCSYCGCPPAKHKRVESNIAKESNKTNPDARGGFLRPYTSEPKWKDKNFGFVPDAKRRISLFDNPACAGKFLCDDYKPNPHDESNITRCKNEANEIKLKIQDIADKISKHDNSLFSVNTGKLKTGLSCHHSFNNDKRYYITSGIGKDVDRLIEDLDNAFAKYRSAYHIGSKSKASKARKKKEQRKKAKKRKLTASDNRRKRACIIFRSLGGDPSELEYEPDKYGIPQIDSIDEETLLLFTSKSDKACLHDLFDSHCFTGEAEKQLYDYLYF